MSLLVNKTNGSVLANVPDGQNVTTACSLSLIGKLSPFYALAHATNFVGLLENFSNDTAPPYPIRGQLWYDTANVVLKLYDGTVWGTITAGGGGGGSGGVGGGSDITFSSPLFVGIDATTSVLAFIVNGKLVQVLSHKTIANAALPANIVVGADTYPFQAKFPTGLLPGANLATDAANYRYIGTATSALYADLAERYESDVPLEPGTVVEIGGSKEIRSTSFAETPNVFGVVSTNPGFELNSAAGTDYTHPYVALAGRVPCRVIGHVTKGDRLVASMISGVAMVAGMSSSWQSIIGRSLSDKTTDGEELLEITVGSR
jgi:hypothetical protein